MNIFFIASRLPPKGNLKFLALVLERWFTTPIQTEEWGWQQIIMENQKYERKHLEVQIKNIWNKYYSFYATSQTNLRHCLPCLWAWDPWGNSSLFFHPPNCTLKWSFLWKKICYAFISFHDSLKKHYMKGALYQQANIKQFSLW